MVYQQFIYISVQFSLIVKFSLIASLIVLSAFRKTNCVQSQ